MSDVTRTLDRFYNVYANGRCVNTCENLKDARKEFHEHKEWADSASIESVTTETIEIIDASITQSWRRK